MKSARKAKLPNEKEIDVLRIKYKKRGDILNLSPLLKVAVDFKTFFSNINLRQTKVLLVIDPDPAVQQQLYSFLRSGTARFPDK